MFVITVKGFKPATSCVKDLDATTAPAKHMWETGSLNLPDFTEFPFNLETTPISPFCGATDTSVLKFWWCLLWVSKPEWVLPYSQLAEVYVMYITWDSPLVQHLLTSWWPAWQLSHSLPHTWADWKQWSIVPQTNTVLTKLCWCNGIPGPNFTEKVCPPHTKDTLFFT